MSRIKFSLLLIGILAGHSFASDNIITVNNADSKTSVNAKFEYNPYWPHPGKIPTGPCGPYPSGTSQLCGTLTLSGPGDDFCHLKATVYDDHNHSCTIYIGPKNSDLDCSDSDTTFTKTECSPDYFQVIGDEHNVTVNYL